MNFKEWLFNEMPLTHYGYNFNLPNDPDEKYDPKTGDQYSLKTFKTPAPWGGETQTLEKNLIDQKFSSRDKNLISHPKTMKTLENKLKNSKFNFNILLVEYKGSMDQYKDQILAYLRNNNINIENSITFAKNSSSGHVLTPWMILHTLGHALTANAPKNSEKSIKKSLDKINDIEDYSVVFEFKSAKQFKVDDEDELIYELIAEYLWNDKIRINSMFINIKKITDEIKNIENNIIKILESCVGTIVYDIN